MAGVASRKWRGLESTTKSYAKSMIYATSANRRCIIRARAVIDAWTMDMRTNRTRLPKLEDEDEEDSDLSDWSSTGAGGRQAYENAIAQQHAIVARLISNLFNTNTK